ncbi:MAG: hypothetical protein PVJ57_02090 [Phycisphaerae bacterium]|jgi:hypothetical protein
MHPLEQALSVIGPIVGGIIVLALFFKFLGRVGRGIASGTTRFTVKGVFDGNTRATIYLNSGDALKDVRILGFTESSVGTMGLPYELGHLLILQHADDRHTLVHARLIRRIEVSPQIS